MEAYKFSRNPAKYPNPFPIYSLGARAAHSCDEIQNKLYIFGGWNEVNPVSDLYILDLEKMVWSQGNHTGDIPNERNNHATAVFGTKIYLHGGHDSKIWYKKHS